MTAISRIVHLRHPGVLHDFTWQRDLPSFGRYNLIYGWNGSGKTTISKMLRALETRTLPANGEVTFCINGIDVPSEEFCQAGIPVRVFNKDFISESVFPTAGDVAPIFVLGKENVEKQKQVELLKKTLADEQLTLGTIRQKKTTAENTLDRFCIDKARFIKDILRSSGTNPYNNYNKGDFSQRAEAMISEGNKDTRILDDTSREKLLTQLRAIPKPKLNLLRYQLPDLRSLGKAVAGLISSTVVSATIESLKDDLTLSSWVHKGVGLHHERKSETCLFCDQTLPGDRLKTLEAHFSTEYEDLLQKVNDQIDTIQAAKETLNGLSFPKTAELYEDLTSEFESATSALQKERESIKSVFEALVKALDTKKSHLFEQVSFEVSIKDLDNAVVANLNAVIQKHNQACDDFQSRIHSAREQLEGHSVAIALDEFVDLVK